MHTSLDEQTGRRRCDLLFYLAAGLVYGAVHCFVHWVFNCHPAATLLELDGGMTIRMDEAKVGDLVRTPTGAEPILGFLHAEAAPSALYYRFHTEDGATMAIASGHYLPVNGKNAAPISVKQGDLLETTNGASAVVRVEQATPPPRPPASRAAPLPASPRPPLTLLPLPRRPSRRARTRRSSAAASTSPTASSPPTTTRRRATRSSGR